MEDVNPSIRIIIAIFSGALGVAFFHEPVVAIMHLIHLTPQHAYPLTPTIPLWMPAISSRIFWGGVWGIFLAFATAKQTSGRLFWRRALLFGAVLISLVGWTAVSAAKFEPLFDGFHVGELITDVVANGAWGLGTAFFIRIFSFATVRWAGVSLT
ncbi:MAG TPA: hypothetical protein VNE16_03920 [Vicinamibacterales bacterium]|nr:hypothetical protein [Vicinamibacterales bacterium]